MRFSLALIAFVAATVYAAPIERRQGAGVGAGCDSVFSDTDTMIGESVRGQGEGLASSLAGARRHLRRQGAGVGAGCDSVFSDTDTMIGESTRGQGEGLASSLSGAKRQLNGIADGITAVTGDAPGLAATSESLDSQLNDIDGDGTNGSAELGEDVGNAELEVGQAVGGSKGQNGGSPPPPGPKRQLNGIADGVTAVTGVAPGAEGVSGNMDSFLNTVDGQGTDDSAEAGAIVGDEELNIGQTVGGSKGQSGGSPPPPGPGH